jgi:hypothetical protein
LFYAKKRFVPYCASWNLYEKEHQCEKWENITSNHQQNGCRIIPCTAGETKKRQGRKKGSKNERKQKLCTVQYHCPVNVCLVHESKYINT